jgi:hypothetical protein
MAAFPALRPASRQYSFGTFPVTEERGFGGGSVRFLHADVSSGLALELGYEALTQAEAKLLRDHYRSQQGGYLSFILSAEAWAGHTDLTTLAPTTTQWVYADQPEESHRKGGLVDVTVQLISLR